MVRLLFFKKAISKFSLCCMKVKSLRQLSFIISNMFVSFEKENELFICSRTSKMLSLGVFDMCKSY